MKKPTLQPDQDSALKDFDENAPENSELWSLLDQASKPKAGDFFSRNVMREIRLEEENSRQGFSLSRLFGTRGFVYGAVAGLAVLFGVVTLWPEGGSVPTGGSALVENSSDVTAERQAQALAQIPMEALFTDDEIEEMKADLEDDLMAVASVDPTVLYDQDLISYFY